MPRIKSDLFDLIEGVANGDLADREIEIDEKFAATVMIVSGGYPGDYEKGKLIVGFDKTSGSVIFHAGTRADSGNVLTAGGRVLAVTSMGSTMREALDVSYRNARILNFEGRYFRTDIGFDL
jgi:phosphoribosylamine--glycine ligase